MFDVICEEFGKNFDPLPTCSNEWRLGGLVVSIGASHLKGWGFIPASGMCVGSLHAFIVLGGFCPDTLIG